MTADLWNQAVHSLPYPHILQTWEWGKFKSAYGWQPHHNLWQGQGGRVRAAAMTLQRSIRGGFSVLYVPRGPLVDWSDTKQRTQVIEDLERQARQSGVIFIKIDPELILGYGVPGTEADRPNPVGLQALADLKQRGWMASNEQIQFRNTVWLDLAGSEEDWLARMKQKTRYNIRLAQRKGVQVRAGGAADLPMLYQMYAKTSIRDGFVIRSEAYYLSLWRSFLEQGLAEPLIAEVDGQAVGGIILFAFAGRAWYLYGMSIDAHREKMPNYLLQWEAMRRAKERGCTCYDLWGAPDVFDESDSLWGVFRFKEGLGGMVVRTAGALDFTARSGLYALYTRILPRVLDVMRRRGRARTRQEVVL